MDIFSILTMEKYSILKQDDLRITLALRGAVRKYVADVKSSEPVAAAFLAVHKVISESVWIF